MAEDETIRTAKGKYLSFDVLEGGENFLLCVSGIGGFRVELTPANMEELMDLIGKVYYGAVDEDSETFFKRLVKEAMREKETEDKAKEPAQPYQQYPGYQQYPVYPYGPHGPGYPAYPGGRLYH